MSFQSFPTRSPSEISRHAVRGVVKQNIPLFKETSMFLTDSTSFSRFKQHMKCIDKLTHTKNSLNPTRISSPTHLQHSCRVHPLHSPTYKICNIYLCNQMSPNFTCFAFDGNAKKSHFTLLILQRASSLSSEIWHLFAKVFFCEDSQDPIRVSIASPFWKHRKWSTSRSYWWQRTCSERQSNRASNIAIGIAFFAVTNNSMLWKQYCFVIARYQTSPFEDHFPLLE